MMNKYTFYFSAIMILFCYAASAQSTRTVEESQLINKAEAAFSRLSSLRAEFIQIAADGTISKGMIYLRRPYQLRLDYLNPDSLSLVTSKRVIYIDDKVGKQVDVYPLSETPFAPILRDEVRFTGPEFLTKARLESGIISIEMSRDKGDGAGSLTLEFNADTSRLMRWIIIDAIGVKTTVSLQNPIYDIRLENKLFGVPSYEPEKNN
jgi:outer membrane lipoprotein-sorting protein